MAENQKNEWAQQIRSGYLAGMNNPELAVQLGISQKRVRALSHRPGVLDLPAQWVLLVDLARELECKTSQLSTLARNHHLQIWTFCNVRCVHREDRAALARLMGERIVPGTPGYLGVQEAAERLGISQSSIWKFQTQGQFKWQVFTRADDGQHLLFLESEVMATLKERNAKKIDKLEFFAKPTRDELISEEQVLSLMGITLHTLRNWRRWGLKRAWRSGETNSGDAKLQEGYSIELITDFLVHKRANAANWSGRAIWQEHLRRLMPDLPAHDRGAEAAELVKMRQTRAQQAKAAQKNNHRAKKLRRSPTPNWVARMCRKGLTNHQMAKVSGISVARITRIKAVHHLQQAPEPWISVNDLAREYALHPNELRAVLSRPELTGREHGHFPVV